MDNDSVAIVGGAGDQGFGLALRWAGAGKRVVIGSRSRERGEDAARRAQAALGDGVRVEGADNSEAVSRAPLVVLTVPFEAQIPTLTGLKAAFRRDQIVVDVTVPLETSVGGNPTRVVGVWAGSAAEQAARHLPEGVRLAAAFHNVSAHALQELEKPVECDVFVCAEQKETREALRPWVEAVRNCRYVDGGRLENARIVEALTALLIGVNRRHKIPAAGLRITGLEP